MSGEGDSAPGVNLLGGGFGSQQNFQLGKVAKQANKDDEDDEAEESKQQKLDKAKSDPSAPEYMMNYTGEFENWEAKKIKILDVFRPQTENLEIGLGDGKRDDVDRAIRMGKGKSRLDQLEKKGGASTTTTQTRHGTLISAKDFSQQLERLNKEMKKFWEKDDKVACMRIAI